MSEHINSIKIDMHNSNPFIAALALAALGNIGSAEMVRDLQPELDKLAKNNSNPYIAKKILLVAVRSIRKVPDLIDGFMSLLATA